MYSKILLVTAWLLCSLWLMAAGPETEPRFSDDKQLIRPEGYREWIFVGASLGMSYEENVSARHPKFHNVYINPSSYQAFRRTGEFPEKTILVMEVWTAGSQSSINRQGNFEDQFAGVEAAVKDSSRFPEGWAYFSFNSPNGGPPKAKAAAFPQKSCWSCHKEHAATDNVFSQFYPILKRQP